MEDRELRRLLDVFNEKLNEAQRARGELVDYLEGKYEIHGSEEEIEDRCDWCFGVDEEVIKELVRSAREDREEFDNEDEYYRSAEAGDYSPSHPWDAPGMSIKDFI